MSRRDMLRLTWIPPGKGSSRWAAVGEAEKGNCRGHRGAGGVRGAVGWGERMGVFGGRSIRAGRQCHSAKYLTIGSQKKKSSN